MATLIRAYLAVEHGLDAETFAGLVAAEGIVDLIGVSAGLDTADRQIEDVRCDVLVIACAAHSDRALMLIDLATKADPDRPVLVLGTGSPPGFVRRVFEEGGEDILLMPQHREDVAFAIQKTFARKHGGVAQVGGRTDVGRLIVVLGPKGGTGKTLTATNLAVALAKRGYSTAIVDLDLQFGDVGLAMGLAPETTIHELSISSGTVDLDKLEAYMIRHSSGAHALLAPNRPDKASTVTTHLLQDVFPALRSGNDYVIVDTPPGFTPEVITTIDASTDIVMVGMLDSLSLKNTKLGLETLDLMGYESEKIRLVLNRAHSRVGISNSDVVAVLGREPDILIPSDREIPRAVNEGTSIVAAQPQSEAALAFGKLADLFAGFSTNGAGPAPAPSARGSRWSAIGRRK